MELQTDTHLSPGEAAGRMERLFAAVKPARKSGGGFWSGLMRVLGFLNRVGVISGDGIKNPPAGAVSTGVVFAGTAPVKTHGAGTLPARAWEF